MTKNLERSIFQSYKTIYIHACEKIKQVFDLEKAKAVGKKSSGRLSEAFGNKRQTERQKDRFFFPRSILDNKLINIMNLYRFDSSTLEFKKVPYSNVVVFSLLILLCTTLMGISFAPRTEVIEKLTEHERFIIIDQENVFSEEAFIEEIKSLNFRYPHIVYAQSVIETGRFSSMIFKENHNLFGMKEARIRANLAKGTNRGHAFYDNWKHSLYDYAFYYQAYLQKLDSEEKYFDYINQRYAEDPNYDVKVRREAAKAKSLFE